MLNLDPGKLFVILVVALIVLGPERLPRVARQAGGIWRELNRYRDQVRDEVRSAIPDLDLPRIPRPSNMIASLLAEPASTVSAKGEPPTRATNEALVADGPMPAADDPSMN